MRGNHNRLRPAVALVHLVLVVPSFAATVRGTVSISGRFGAADPSNAVVWLEGAPAEAPPEAPFTIETKDKAFKPDLLIVPVGSTVAFPNGDSIRHNVFSVSGGNRFDLGLYGKGETREAVLKEPGIVRVFCNVHSQMAATIVITPNRFATRVRRDGTFEITGVPGGRHTLRVWDERGGEASRAIDVDADGVAEADVSLDGRKFKKVPHLDKDGKPYSERDRSTFYD